MLTTGNQLKAARHLAGLSQIQLAKMSGVSTTTLSAMEGRGAAVLSSGLDTIKAVMDALATVGVECASVGTISVTLHLMARKTVRQDSKLSKPRKAVTTSSRKSDKEVASPAASPQRLLSGDTEVDAIEWDGTSFPAPVPNWLAEALRKSVLHPGSVRQEGTELSVHTKDGKVRVSPGDWLVCFPPGHLIVETRAAIKLYYRPLPPR